MNFKYKSSIILLFTFLIIDRSETWWFLRNITKSSCPCFSTYMVWTFWSQRQRSSCKKVRSFKHNYTLFCYILYDNIIVLKCYYNYVLHRLKKHVSDPTNPPILIFPEGTCINNTSVMQFKKGSFDVDSVIYPVAIKVISFFF